MRTTVDLPPATHRQVPAPADARGQSMSVVFADLAVDHVVGHRPVADGYLAGLALHHGSRLAILDAAVGAALPGAVLVIPGITLTKPTHQ